MLACRATECSLTKQCPRIFRKDGKIVAILFDSDPPTLQLVCHCVRRYCYEATLYIETRKREEGEERRERERRKREIHLSRFHKQTEPSAAQDAKAREEGVREMVACG